MCSLAAYVISFISDVTMHRQRIELSAALIILSAAQSAAQQKALVKKKQSKRKWWVRPGLRQRNSAGFYETMKMQLRDVDSDWFKSCMRMNEADFDFLVTRLTPYICKKDTNCRKAITVAERLAVTLRYLASGLDTLDLMNMFLMARSTILGIVHETCVAIFGALKEDFLKVSNVY